MNGSPGWLPPAVLAVLLWGLWGVFQKLATNQMSPRAVYVISTAGVFAVVCLVLLMSRTPLQPVGRGILFAILAGGCSSLGGLLFLSALSRGKASLVITFTALYPLVTILISFSLLGESVSLKQGIGIALALCAMAMLAG